MELVFALDVEVLVADHVGEEEGLDLAERAVAAPSRGQMAAAVGGVGARPALDGLFAIEEDQPDGVAVELSRGRLRGFGAQPVGDGHKQAGGGSAVVGADKVDGAQRVVGFVVRAEDDDARSFCRGSAR